MTGYIGPKQPMRGGFLLPESENTELCLDEDFRQIQSSSHLHQNTSLHISKCTILTFVINEGENKFFGKAIRLFRQVGGHQHQNYLRLPFRSNRMIRLLGTLEHQILPHVELKSVGINAGTIFDNRFTGPRSLFDFIGNRNSDLPMVSELQPTPEGSILFSFETQYLRRQFSAGRVNEYKKPSAMTC
ncbi:MAG: hypothetical protein CM1200mP39_26090 [Dehalococcoidia bacterium]|nr:MAG: hypothetical protein CM1200mP39_26090 [Dehalococcoidia bacterium]